MTCIRLARRLLWSSFNLIYVWSCQSATLPENPVSVDSCLFSVKCMGPVYYYHCTFYSFTSSDLTVCKKTVQYCKLTHAQLGASNSSFLSTSTAEPFHDEHHWDWKYLFQVHCILIIQISSFYSEHLASRWKENKFRCSGVRLRYLSTTCAICIENGEGWWSSSCCGLVAKHWRLSPKCPGFDSWWLQPFTFLYIFSPQTSNFIYCLHISMRMIYVWDLGQCLDPRSFIQRCHLKSV